MSSGAIPVERHSQLRRDRERPRAAPFGARLRSRLGRCAPPWLGDPPWQTPCMFIFEEGSEVARKTVVVSDLSGEAIEEGKAATINIRFSDARKDLHVLDVTEQEAEELGRNGRKQARRGRRPKGAGGGS